MKIVVIGGGNGSYAAVADFVEAGHDVRWWRRNASDFADVTAAGGITVTDYKGSRPVKIAPTDDLAKAMSGADLIVANPLETMDAESISATLVSARGVEASTNGELSKSAFGDWLIGELGRRLDR